MNNSISFVNLSEIIDLISGRDLTSSQYNDKKVGIPYIMGASNMVDGQLIIERWTDSPTVLGYKGDVILSVKGTVGELLILEEEKVHLSRQVMALRSKQGYLKKYILFYLTSYMKQLKDKAKGLIPGITREDILQAKVPNFNEEQQKVIVEVLEKAQTLIDKRKRQIELLDQLAQSVFLEMFGDPFKNPKKWPIVKIEDLAEKTQYGTSKKADEHQGQYAVLRMNNITYSGRLELTDLKYVDLTEKETEKYLVYKGEVLFNRTNSKELVGKTTVYNKNEPMAYAGYLIKLIPNEKANGEFISAYLNSKYGKQVLLNMAKNIVGMANINAQELKSIKIYCPPIELQENFSKVIKSIERQRMILEESLIEYENLFNSLMQRAFRGELFKEKIIQ